MSQKSPKEGSASSIAKRSWTLMLVPEHGRGKVLQLRFRLAQVRRLVAVMAVLVLLAMLGIGMVMTSLPRSLAQGELIDENLALKARIREIEGTLDRLEGEIRRLRLYDTQLKGAGEQGIPGFGPLGDDETPWTSGGRLNKADGRALLDARHADGDELIARDGVNMDLEGMAYDETMGEAMEEIQGAVFAASGSGRAEEWAISVHARGESLLELVQAVEMEMGQVVESAEYWRARRSAMPTDWPVDGHLTSGFGYRRSPFTRAWKFHRGLDISAPRGTPVFATASGTVKMSRFNAGYGRMIAIDHGFGILSRYAHNSKLMVREGEMVHRGQVIATVGSTGQSTGPHLHYEVFIEGTPVDPQEYLE
jgi:hypothetical protein